MIGNRPLYEPTPEEIAAATAEIRKTWDARRFGADREPIIELTEIDTGHTGRVIRKTQGSDH